MKISVPVKIVDGKKWGQLSTFSLNHELCAEKFEKIDDKYSFAGGHRVRLYRLRKNVHWRIPEGIELDIADVDAKAQPKRRQK